MTTLASPSPSAKARSGPVARVVATLASLRADRVFLCASLPLGLLLIALTPPHQVPDEPAHSLRAYAISEGQLFAEPLGGGPSGNILPVSLQLSAARLVADVPFQPERRVDPAIILDELRRPLRPEERAATEFTGASVYFPIVYAPQAAGMFIARTMGGSPLWILYAGRLLNLLVAVGLTFVAIRLMPIHRWTLALVALTPMVLITRSSASADGLTNALAFLLIAMALRSALINHPRIGWRPLAVIAALGMLLGLCKLTYFTLAGAVLLIPASRYASRLGQLGWSAVVLIAAGLPAVLWGRHVTHLYRPAAHTAPDPGEQVAYVLEHPLRVLRVLLEAPFSDANFYFSTTLGRLGWLDTPLPPWVIFTLLGLNLTVAVVDSGLSAPAQRSLTLPQRSVAAVVAFGTLYAVFATLYIAWNSVGSGRIEGVQGRYFLPLIPLLLAVLHRGPNAPLPVTALRTGAVCVAVALGASATIVATWQRYFG